MICQVYYEAKEIALNNGEMFHIAAYTDKGTIGTNNRKRFTSKYRKHYSNGNTIAYDLHAEVDLVLRCQTVPRKITVVRFRADGNPTMAKPCIHCQNFLRHFGVQKVKFTNWEGMWEEMKL